MAGERYHTNEELVQFLKIGSTEAFGELMDRYSSRIYRFSMGYLKNRHDAEEIVQEVFLKIWKMREELLSDKSLDYLLFTIAKNGILNTIRKEKSQQAYLDYVSLHPGRNILVDDELNFRELQGAYEKAITQLSPKRREIFRLRKERFLSNAQIAAHLGVSVKTIENQMTSAIAAIRRSLRSQGFSFLLFFELFH